VKQFNLLWIQAKLCRKKIIFFKCWSIEVEGRL